MEAGSYYFSSAFVDLDNDGKPELAVTGDFGNSKLFWNNGDGTFSEGGEAAGVGHEMNGMGSAFGDVDGDGSLDWFVSSIHDPRYCLGHCSHAAYGHVAMSLRCRKRCLNKTMWCPYGWTGWVFMQLTMQADHSCAPVQE